jgi:hypothetical protein
MNNIKYLLFFFIASFACTLKESLQEVPKVKPTLIESQLNVSKIANKLEVLIVESVIPISGVPNIMIGASYVYLFDRDYSRFLYQIDQNGKIKNVTQFQQDRRLNNHSITTIFLKKIAILEL